MSFELSYEMWDCLFSPMKNVFGIFLVGGGLALDVQNGYFHNVNSASERGLVLLSFIHFFSFNVLKLSL